MGKPSHLQRRMSEKIDETVNRLRLDLRGLHVLTEAATGFYRVTPVIAARAGAKVVALTRDSRHGTVDQVRRETTALAKEMGVEDRIEIVESLSKKDIAGADIATNSGHLRPLNAEFVGQMKLGSVTPLMYESWECRPGEIDLDACRRQGIVVAGTNERHPDLRVFDYLGLLAISGLLQCQVPVTFSKILLVCDNPFCPFIAKTLLACGAVVEVLGSGDVPDLDGLQRRTADAPGSYDAIVVADTPGERPVVGPAGKSKYSFEQIGRFDALVQLWGDVDRRGLDGIPCCPATPPPRGHMGILLSALGPEPIIRLQAGGLKVGQVLAAGAYQSAGDISETDYVDQVLASR